ncbi:sulfite exporter TauE/SafE family protein [Myceligenerans pegani]|uniref:Probable membrane transporter protein n=1 Tax=Myceligenerans pegani TaxID=2776917 RepID=A0ABR9N4L4_9MICO|nr:sulfite exporter TauE/SafE family protein [Myceligenerans sp. TRM 65318]MBE1878018.1 sulfite exporter TauE/SafE family protein [Myceligenerans sp. TRM 65318]MBE3020289.1 sulfite exporter TauE/SafE family protein [Myceligenerans sp. TRM 65318]
MLALLVLAILVGGSLQRVTGMGFGLVAGPFIVLLVGPLEGVLLVNVVGATMALLIVGRLLRGVDWRRYAWLAGASVSVSVPAALLLRGASPAALEIGIGAVVIGAMTLALVTSRLHGERRRFRERDPRPLVVTGVASGFGSVAAGIGGPPLAVYAVLERWDTKSFAATAQPFFMTNALAAMAAKVIFAGATFPAFAVWEWVVIGLALVASIGLGELLAPRISREATRRVLVVLAYVGGAATLGRGLAQLL